MPRKSIARHLHRMSHPHCVRRAARVVARAASFFAASARADPGVMAMAMAFVATTTVAWPASAQADCIDEAAARQHVNPFVLRAIGWQESRLQPAALGHNHNGSVDLGAFQINSVHLADLARYGIDARSLSDGCVSAYVAAWHYRHQVDLYGNTWVAVGAYHSRTPANNLRYANQIAAILRHWKVLDDAPSASAPPAP